MCRLLIQGRFISQWNLPANQADGTRSECYEYENTMGSDDEVFYVLEGTTTFLIGDTWVDADKGTFLRMPANTIHDFKNTTDQKTGVLNFFIPGGFENSMPSIVKWFEGH
jgi:oxalate decarboxylase/phosphoglucose isomerase-like protein (cupin superfamily)